MYLLRDRTARRIGGTFEFLFLVLLPVTVLVAFIASCIGIYDRVQHPFSWGSYGSALELSMYLSYSIGYLFRIIGFIFGFIILVIPGITLSKREDEGSLLRFLPIKRGEIFIGMTKLQLASFLLGPAIFYIFEFSSELILTMVVKSLDVRLGHWNLLPPWPLENKFLFFVWALVGFSCISIYSIHPSFRYRLVWAAFIALVAGGFIFALAAFGGAGLSIMYWDEPIHGLWEIPYEVRVVILIAISMLVAVLLGLAAIKYRINPAR